MADVFQEKAEAPRTSSCVASCEQAMVEQARYLTLAELSPVGIFQTDAQGNCTYVNKRWCEIVGRPAQAALGEGWVRALGGVQGEDRVATWYDAVRRGEPFRGEIRLRRSGGGTSWVLGQGVPQKGPQGELSGYVGTITDISDRKCAEEELRAAKDAAELANEARNDFMGMVTHELRTPMNSIIGYTELLLDGVEGPVSEEQRRSLSRVLKNARHLMRLVEDILDLSRMEAGRRGVGGGMDLKAQEFCLRERLQEAVQALEPRANDKKLRLSAVVRPGVPDTLNGDPDRLRQVLTNLMENAIKFTERGEVTVLVEPAPEGSPEPDRACLHFEVRDTGIGIPSEQRDAIFRPFVQGDASTTRRHQGIGLGLTISLNLVELMRGRIWVESQVGKGSAFHFTACFGLPRADRPGHRHWAQQTMPL